MVKSIAADHKDLIHDVSYDFHGRRMATCSSDQSVKARNPKITLLACMYTIIYMNVQFNHSVRCRLG